MSACVSLRYCLYSNCCADIWWLLSNHEWTAINMQSTGSMVEYKPFDKMQLIHVMNDATFLGIQSPCQIITSETQGIQVTLPFSLSVIGFVGHDITRWWFPIFFFSPRNLGKMNPFWRAYFSDGLVQPPTRITYVTVTTWIIPFLVGNPNLNLLFVTGILGGG